MSHFVLMRELERGSMDEVAWIGFRADAERSECGEVLS